MTLATLQIITFVLIVIIFILCAWLFIIENRLKKLFSGKNAKSLEGVISTLGSNISALETFRDTTRAYLTRAEERLRRSVQGVETIRFNAFKGNGEGGNQSFAIALLSENGDGTVISSIYARERMSVYAKPVKGFTSEFEMTTEEKDAVDRARR